MKFYGFATALTTTRPHYLDITCTALFVEEANRHHRTPLPELSIEQHDIDTQNHGAMTKAIDKTIYAYNTVFDLQQKEAKTDPPPLAAIIGKAATANYPTPDIRKTVLDYAIPTKDMSPESIKLRRHFSKALRGSRLYFGSFIQILPSDPNKNKNLGTEEIKEIADLIPLFDNPKTQQYASDHFNELTHNIAKRALMNTFITKDNAIAPWFGQFGFPTLESVLKDSHHHTLSKQQIEQWDQIIHDTVVDEFKTLATISWSQINSRGNFYIKREGESRGRYFEDPLIPLIWDRIDIYRAQPEAVRPQIARRESILGSLKTQQNPSLTENDVRTRDNTEYRIELSTQIDAEPQ